MNTLKLVMGLSGRRFDSPLEKRLVKELLNYHLVFETQYQVGKYRIDIAFPAHKIGLEIDGYEYHRSEPQKERDRLRDEFLKVCYGWTIERVPGWFAYREPEASIAKAIRHIPGIEKNPRYQLAKRKAILWFSRELYNDGYSKEAAKIVSNQIGGVSETGQSHS